MSPLAIAPVNPSSPMIRAAAIQTLRSKWGSERPEAIERVAEALSWAKIPPAYSASCGISGGFQGADVGLTISFPYDTDDLPAGVVPGSPASFDSWNFSGASGSSVPIGMGCWGGNVYTWDVKKLIADTAWFEWQAAIVYASVLFFDATHKNLLGHFQGGGFGLLGGFGGGSGGWFDVG